MNAFNFMDGANGIAGGSSVIALAGLVLIASIAGSSFIATAAFLLGVALMGFLPSNFVRGVLFMGDNGSQSVSFLIAALGIVGAIATMGV